MHMGIFEGETLAIIKSFYCHTQKNSNVYIFWEKITAGVCKQTPRGCDFP